MSNGEAESSEFRAGIVAGVFCLFRNVYDRISDKWLLFSHKSGTVALSKSNSKKLYLVDIILSATVP